jgi:hypothetical protein
MAKASKGYILKEGVFGGIKKASRVYVNLYGISGSHYK